MIELSTPLSQLKGARVKTLERLKKFKIETVKDLLWHFPFRYEDFSNISKISDLKIGQRAVIRGEIVSVKMWKSWKKRMFIIEALVSDSSGSIRAVWFNQRFLITVIKKGITVNLAGKIIETKGGLTISHPIHEIINIRTNTDNTRTSMDSPHKSVLSQYESVSLRHTGRIVPVYPETRGLTSKMLRFLIQPLLKSIGSLEDPLPEEILKSSNLPDLETSLQAIHFPETLRQAQGAKKRFAFEDLFFLQLVNFRQRLRLAQEKAYSAEIDLEEIKEMLKKLPFELTHSQKKSLWEILQDLKKSHPMNRLLQGDVGSGKTIVAILAALSIIRPFDSAQGKQVAFMAPTEVLAQQHYNTFKKIFFDFDKGAGIITSSIAKVFYGDGLESDIKKSEIIQKIENGEIKIVFGTHSLIQKYIKFSSLAFVVIDEQHRFGVSQRAALATRTETELTRTDTEDKNNLLYGELTYKIRGIVFKVKKELGLGHKENIYQKALEKEFTKENLSFEKEKSLDIRYDNEKIGTYRPDFVVENEVIIEIKALPSVGKFEKQQIWHYLKATNYRLALLINFGHDDVNIERIIYGYGDNESHYKSVSSPTKSVLLPHFLSMSATPIPRTLSLTIFGDLDLSIIDELPKGRKEIITKIVSPLNRDKAYAFIRGQVKKGRQIFVICPRITQTNTDNTQTNTENSPYQSVFSPRESVLWETKAVKEEYEKLSQKIFPDLKVAMLHGKMKAKEKIEIMNKFKNNEIDILVSTSVVEVGVDVPNATIMMIEGSDRFGLAQLYQFRGRVGRGEHQSFCFLFTDSSSQTTRKRLRSLIEAKNGFELAEKDLAIRGPGEFLGESQTGIPDLAMKAVQNPELVKSGREAAESILKSDPELKNYPLLKKRLDSFEKKVHLE